jgi:hypothetical protein
MAVNVASVLMNGPNQNHLSIAFSVEENSGMNSSTW